MGKHPILFKEELSSKLCSPNMELANSRSGSRVGRLPVGMGQAGSALAPGGVGGSSPRAPEDTSAPTVAHRKPTTARRRCGSQPQAETLSFSGNLQGTSR